jgi:sugar lactone lactonase YvrE
MKNYLSKLLASFLVLALPFALRAQNITTIAGNGATAYTAGVPATSTGLYDPPGVAVDSSGNIYVADQMNNAIRKITTSGITSTIAGTGVSGYSGDGGPATLAKLNQPTNVTVDRSGNLYISDEFNNVVRKINYLGIISTIAGNTTPAYSGDGSPATNAALWYPYRTVLDASGNVYIADQNNHVVRKVTTATGIITTIAGNGTAGLAVSGPATATELQAPEGLAIDASGNLYIADANNHNVYKVNTAGMISTFAGVNTRGYTGDGGPATDAKFSYPSQVLFDRAGNLYISDFFDQVVRRVSTAGTITTIAGNGTGGFMGDGSPATAAELNGPDGMAFDLSGNLIIADVNNNRLRKLYLSTSNIPEPVNKEHQFSLFPDPNSGNFKLSGTLNSTKPELIDVSINDGTGKRIYKNTFMAPYGIINEPINLDKGLSDGIYMMQINEDGETSVIRFVIKQ